ncbi:MAG: GAF domain-containing protein [Chitinophagaceae bacterium]|nr:GAF domain-containing protein [Chitinophagaceae bacterium]
MADVTEQVLEQVSCKVLKLNPDVFRENPGLKGHVSFAPYVKFLRSKIESPLENRPDVFRFIIKKLEAHPELLQPITDFSILEKYGDILQLVATTLFPVSTQNMVEYYSVGTPYRFEIFYYSPAYGYFFNPDEKGYVQLPPEVPFEYIQQENLFLAYRMILKKYYNIQLAEKEKMMFHVVDRITGLRRYSRVLLDENFVEVHLEGSLPELEKGTVCHKTFNILDFEKLQKCIPLSLFSFEGFVIRHIRDVTAEESITEVKNALLVMQTKSVSEGYEKLNSAIESLIELKNVEVSLSPFPRVNKKFVLPGEYTRKSIVLKSLPEKVNKDEAYRKLARVLENNRRPIFFQSLMEPGEQQNDFPFAEYLKKAGLCCYIIIPLFDKGELIGMMEAASTAAGQLNRDVLAKFEPLYSYFELALRNSIQLFQKEIEDTVKDKFTALQPSVEWKFADLAFDYLQNRKKGTEAEIGTAIFDNVYPIYGAVDIRNSSVERSQGIQKDLQEQLQLIDDTIDRLKEHVQLPILDELLFKNDFLKSRSSEILMAEDEVRINEYLENDIHSLFKHLMHTNTEAHAVVKNYLDLLDEQSGHIYHHRREFDESLNAINNAVARYLEAEEKKIQQFYPHYFERYKTDGIEYNIYIGESIAPDKPFDYLYLKNLRLWQLSSMAEIARLTHRLVPSLKVPLQTTQLILVHGNPIAISFRKDERRFDVEGAYNIRYEIMKKRIDKVRVLKTGERLTQPGKISIVYSHAKEANEYEQYIHFLQSKKLLLNDLERLELEEVQGLTGLKAVRVGINMGE